MSCIKPRPRCPGNMHPGAQTQLQEQPKLTEGFLSPHREEVLRGTPASLPVPQSVPQSILPEAHTLVDLEELHTASSCGCSQGAQRAREGRMPPYSELLQIIGVQGFFLSVSASKNHFTKWAWCRAPRETHIHSPIAALMHKSFCMPALGRAHERSEGCGVKRTDNGPALMELLLLQGTRQPKAQRGKLKQRRRRSGRDC